jgi:hypothetical protein
MKEKTLAIIALFVAIGSFIILGTMITSWIFKGTF